MTGCSVVIAKKHATSHPQLSVDQNNNMLTKARRLFLCLLPEAQPIFLSPIKLQRLRCKNHLIKIIIMMYLNLSLFFSNVILLRKRNLIHQRYCLSVRQALRSRVIVFVSGTAHSPDKNRPLLHIESVV